VPKDRSEFSITAPEAGRKVVELVPETAVEAARAEGIGAVSLSIEIEGFINDLEAARGFYRDPALRRFLELPDEAVESEIAAMRRAMALLGETTRAAVKLWCDLHLRRRPRSVPNIHEFFGVDDGGAK